MNKIDFACNASRLSKKQGKARHGEEKLLM